MLCVKVFDLHPSCTFGSEVFEEHPSQTSGSNDSNFDVFDIFLDIPKGQFGEREANN